MAYPVSLCTLPRCSHGTLSRDAERQAKDVWHVQPLVLGTVEHSQIHEVINHALVGIPEEQVRYHVCWGSGHRPHVNDIGLEHFADLMLKINAQAYSVEAGNVRHAHEWRVWGDVKLPDGKILVPGVVSHATDLVEHPELVAERLVNYAGLVGKENLQAGTDCGIGYRVGHAEVAWAKLRALSEGCRIASEQLWG